MQRSQIYGVLAALALCAPQVCPGQTIITTLAGSVYTFPADGIAAVNAPVGVVTAVTEDKNGNVYFAELATDRVFKIDTKGILTRFAGNGIQGYAGDGGPATSASLFNPKGLAFDSDGNMYISDTGNFRIRMVTPAGIITTFAGNGTQGFSGDGGPAIAASLGSATRVAVDPWDFVFISDTDNHRIRRVAPGGVISTVAGNGTAASTGDGGLATLASLQTPAGLIIDTAGNLYVADTAAARVREIEFGGTIITVAGTGVTGTSGDGGPATKARISGPAGVAVDQEFNLYVADQTGSDIRRITTLGTISTIAGTTGVGLTGDGGPAASSALYTPLDLFVASTGALLIADSNNFRVRSISGQIISTIAGNGNWRYTGDGGVSTSATMPAPYGLAIGANGSVNICDNYANRVRTVNPFGIINLTAGTNIPGYAGDAGPATAASLVACQGIAVDSSGNLYVADTGNRRIRRVSAAGIVTTVAGNGTAGFSGDGGPAVSASLSLPQGVAVDGAGNLYIADTNNNRIRKVSSSGIITTIAGNGNTGYGGDGAPAVNALLNGPSRITLDSAGNIYLTDNGNNVVRAISTQGIIRTVAGNGQYGFSGDGGQAIAASLADPLGLAIDSAGDILIADADNKRIRQVNSSGVISTIAGNGTATLSGDGRPPLSTGFGSPSDVALDASGNIYISDRNNGRVRRIQPTPSSLVISETGMTFSGAVDSDSVPTQTLQILNGGAGAIGWSASASITSGTVKWLSVAPVQGTSTSTTTSSPITVTANPAGLAAGNYYGQIQIASPGVANSPRYVTVVLKVLSAAQTSGASVSPAALLFSASTGGSNPASQTFTVSELHGAALPFTASLTFGQAAQWLTMTQTTNSVAPDKPAVITLKPNIAGLSAQVYTAALNLSFSDASMTTIPATLTVNNAATTSALGTLRPHATGSACTPTKLLPVMTALSSGFNVPAGWPVLIAAQVIDDCGQSMTTGSVVATFTNGDPALPLTSALNGMWTGTWSPRKIANLSITLTAQEPSPAIGGTAQVSGQSSANADPPILSAGGIVNAASFAPGGPASPGSLLAIFGTNLTAPTAAGYVSAPSLPLPTQLNNTQVLIGGVPMPLLFVSPDQINAMAPFGLASNTVQQVIVQNVGALSVPEPATVNPASAASFTYNGSGSGLVLAVAINPDGSSYLITPTAPAHPGAVVVLFCTGLGAVQTALEAGQSAPLTPLAPITDSIAVTIGGVSANVLFAGLVPNFTGFYQVNVVIPTSATGDNLPVVLTVGGASGTNATLSVH